MIVFKIIFIPVCIAIVAVTYTYILTRAGQILSGFYNWLDQVFKTDKRAAEGKEVHPVFMVIMYCEKCFSGQVALWLFLYYNWNNYLYHFRIDYIFIHIFFVLYTIFLSSVIKHSYIKHTEYD